MTLLERRSWPRSRCPPEHVSHTACVRPGRDVQVLDLSRGGALLEGPARLVPDSVVQLRLNGGGRALHLRGRVVRCYVCALDGGIVSYQTGVAFEEYLDLSLLEVASSE